MKRHWQTAELVKYFLLDDFDFELLAGKSGPTRLGYAALLKFFQLEGRFPRAKNEIPLVVIDFLAQQLELAPALYLQYDWQGRQLSRHRSQIRQALGFREPLKKDAQALHQWLRQEVLAQECALPQLKALCYERLRALKIEPLADKPLERLIHSAARAYEQHLAQTIHQTLSKLSQTGLDQLLRRPSLDRSAVESVEGGNEPDKDDHLLWHDLKAEPAGPKLESLLKEVAKLKWLQKLALPQELFKTVTPKVVRQYRMRAATEELHELKRHPAPLRQTLLAAFCLERQLEITDSLVELLNTITHRIGKRAERRVAKQMLRELRRKNNKEKILYLIALAVLENPDQSARQVLFPVVSEEVFKELVEEAELQKAQGDYQQQVHTSMRESYQHHYRRMLAPTLGVLTFRAETDHPELQAVLAAVDYVGKAAQIEGSHFPFSESVPLDWLAKEERSGVVIEDAQGQKVIDRLNFEIRMLEKLREKLRSRQIWVEGARRYGNPAQDLPSQNEWQINHQRFFEELKQPLEAEAFVQKLQTEMEKALDSFNAGLPTNSKVKLETTGSGWITLSPLEALAEPPILQKLKAQLALRWPMTSLLDVLKETALRTGFLEEFRTATAREQLEEETLHKRLLLCLYALGTNIGLKRVSAGDHGQNYRDLVYVRHRYMLRDHLRAAISRVCNATFEARLSSIWGEATSACASDSTKFTAANQNLLTQWHTRYGGPGIMAYWHVERRAVCIYSQLKSCSSSEVASMLEGILRHLSEMEVQKNYVDTHGQGPKCAELL